MAPRTRDAPQPAKARRRRYRTAPERLARDHGQAQHAAEALPQALNALGRPADLVTELAGRLHSHHKRLGKIVGVMCPPLFGGRTTPDLCRVRGWDKTLPSRLLSALPQRSWIKRLRRWGLDVLVPLWRHPARKSEATRSRWPWTWVADDAVVKKSGEPLGRVGPWWRGQAHRGLSGIAGGRLVVVMGDGKRVGPVDCAIRRPDPTGPGGPCRDTRHWRQGRRDGRIAALRGRGVELAPPMVVADRWCSDSKRRRQVATTPQGPCLGEGKSPYVFALLDGRQVKGGDWQTQSAWPWRQSPQGPGMRYARVRATSPTYGAVTSIGGSAPREEQCYMMCLDTAIRGPRLRQAWTRRHWIAACVRTLQHVLATGACQVHSEEAYYGHRGWRLMGCFVLFYTSRVICQGRLTMEESIFSLKHYWRFVDCEALELKALSQGVDEKAA